MERKFTWEDAILLICSVVVIAWMLSAYGCSTAEISGEIKCDHLDDVVVDLRMECRAEKTPDNPQGEGGG